MVNARFWGFVFAQILRPSTGAARRLDRRYFQRLCEGQRAEATQGNITEGPGQSSRLLRCDRFLIFVRPTGNLFFKSLNEQDISHDRPYHLALR